MEYENIFNIESSSEYFSGMSFASFNTVGNKLIVGDNLERTVDDVDRESLLNYTVQMQAGLILLCDNGSLSVNINFKDYNLKKGDVVIILEGSFLRITNASEDIKFCFVATSSDFSDFLNGAVIPMTIKQWFMANPMISLNESLHRDCKSIYFMMKKMVRTPGLEYKEHIAAHYLSILTLMVYQYLKIEQQNNQPADSMSRKEQIFSRFIYYLKNNYTKERKVTFYADKLCLSPKYMSSVIWQVSGKYATEWIDDYVVLESKSLLRNKTMSIKEVCNRMNFPNQSFFAKFFKQHTGMTPREYRMSV